MTGRAIFRDEALDAYRRGMDRDAIPRLTSRPILIGWWLVLAVLIAIVGVAWSVRVPAYVDSAGVVLGQADPMDGGQGPAALVFVSPDQAERLHPGLAVLARVASGTLPVPGWVARIEPGVASPSALERRFAPHGLPPGVVTGPVRIVLLRLVPVLPARRYARSRITAEITTGSIRLLTLLPDVGPLLGGQS